MSGKAFLVLLLAVVVVGGMWGGAYVGGYVMGERKGKSEAEAAAASASTQASQQLQQLRQQFQSQFGQSGQVTPTPQAGGQFQGVQGTPQPGGLGRAGQVGQFLGAGQIGTIQRIENGKLTIATNLGTTVEAALSQSTTVEITSTGTASDLKVGMQVAVVGQQDAGGVVQARSVSVVPAGTSAGGFFGGAVPRQGQGGTPTPQQR